MMDGPWSPPDDELATQLAASRRHWLSEGREGGPLVAPGADLRGLDLAESHLSEAQLQDADLRGARLDHAVLVRAALDGARLDGAHLFAADASRASFHGAVLNDAQAARSKWVRAALLETHFQRAVLMDADMRGAELLATDLTDAHLRHANLSRASLNSATLLRADLTDANLDGALVDSDELTKAVGAELVRGTYVEAHAVAPPTRTGRDATAANSVLELTVAEALRASPEVEEVYTLGVTAGPDFVVVLPHRRYVAIEVKGVLPSGAVRTFEKYADVVVVPDNVRPPPGSPVPVVHLAALEDWLRTSATLLPPTRGAIALASRQMSRLHPWLAIAQHQRVDPSSLSRLAVWVDTARRNAWLLNSGDRRLSELIPAHVDGSGLGRGVRWAEQHLNELLDLQHTALAAQRSMQISPETATELAERALATEKELAAAVADGAAH